MKFNIMLLLGAMFGIMHQTFAAIGPTVMYTPGANATGVPMQPTFTWSNANGAAKYKCQVCTDQGMNVIYTELMNIEKTKQSVKLEQNAGWSNSKTCLEATKVYYWRMVAYDASNNTVASAPFKITIGNFGPVTLTSPGSDAKDQAVQPNFIWKNNDGSSKYRLQVCADQLFTTMVVDVSKTDSGNDLTGTSYQMSSKTAPNTVLEIGKTYYWRILGYDQSGNIATSLANKFTVITPTFPYYPIKTADQLSSVYGPRNVTGTNWFHGAIDIASEGASTINVVAPCNCKVVYKQVIDNTADLVDFINTEPNGNPKSFRIQHVPISNIAVDATFKRGEVIFTTLEKYENNGYHVHMNAWDKALAKDTKGSEKGSAESPAAVNPLKYWKFTSSVIANSNFGPGPTGTWPRDPDVGNLRYFYFTITCPRTDFTLNKIIMAITDATGATITQNFLANPAAATLDFSVANSPTLFNKEFSGATQTWTTPITATGAVGMPIPNGVRILCPNFDNGSNVQKVYHFRYYIKDNAPNPKFFQAQLYDCNGNTGPMRLAAVTNDLPATPINETVPKPPSIISVTQITNGLQIAWSNIPSNKPPADYWAVYRKKAGSTESPLFIGITTKALYQDRTDVVTNTIIPGTTYSYTVAGVNHIGQGAYGAWVNGTMTSKPNDFIFQSRTVMASESDLIARNSITIKDVNIWGTGVKRFIAGGMINIYEIVNVANGAVVNFSVDPAVK